MLLDYLKGDKLLLTNSFTGLKRDLCGCYEEYDRIFMFGLDKNLNDEIRIEMCARMDEDILETKIGLESILFHLRQIGISYTISNQPTLYLCNAAYYEMLKKNQTNVILIHIPSFKNMSQQLIDAIVTVFN